MGIFDRNYLKQGRLVYNHNFVVNIYIVYGLEKGTVNSPDFTIQNALFGAMKITKDINTSQYQYHYYGICFDTKSAFSTGNITNGKNVIIFGADMSFSSYATKRANNIYVLGKDFIQGISTTGHTTIYEEGLYRTNFTEPNKKFVLSLYYNGDDSYLFVNGIHELKFKAKNSEIQKNPIVFRKSK